MADHGSTSPLQSRVNPVEAAGAAVPPGNGIAHNAGAKPILLGAPIGEPPWSTGE